MIWDRTGVGSPLESQKGKTSQEEGVVHDAAYSSQGKKIQHWTKAHRVKNPPAVWASQFLGWEDP